MTKILLEIDQPDATSAGKFADWPSKQGVVYFIGAGRPAVAIKIGITENTEAGIKQRLIGIQGGNHEAVELLGIIVFKEGDTPMLQAQAKEQALHKQFGHLRRFKDNTVGHEWFKVADDLLDYIAPYKALPDGWPRSVAKPVT